MGGSLVRNGSISVRLSRKATERISHARKRLPPDRKARTFDGVVREFDKDRQTFILRSGTGDNICTVSFSDAQYEDVWVAFENDAYVTVVTYEESGQPIVELVSMVPKSGADVPHDEEPDDSVQSDER